MNNLEDFYNLLNLSRISLIGYSFKDERLKDELLSKIPHIKVSDIDSSFNLMGIIRDNKIESLIGDNSLGFNFIVIDINDLKISIETKNNTLLEQLNILRKSIENIAFQFYDSEYKLIITSPVYKTMSGDINNISYIGGSKSVYLSDVVFNIEDDKIRILKNRYGYLSSDFENNIINIVNLKENSYEYSK